MNITLLITDIGGVLVKTDEAIITCIQQVFDENNIPHGTKEDLLSAFGVSIYDYILQYLPNNHKDRADYCYQEFKKIYPSKATHMMSVFKGVDSTLESISRKGIGLAVLSCMTHDEVKKNLSLLEFKDFNTIFSLENYKDKRPSPTGLRMIMKKMNVCPEETMYVGDTVNDVRMAKNAGVISVAVKTGAQDNAKLKQEQPDYLLNDFSELLTIIDSR